MIVSYEVGPTSDHFRPPRSGYYAPSNWLSIENSVFFLGFSNLDCFGPMLMFACCPPRRSPGEHLRSELKLGVTSFSDRQPEPRVVYFPPCLCSDAFAF